MRQTRQTRQLTPRQQLFAQEYLLDLNATQAAIRAGYSRKTAEQLGYQLLQKTSVQRDITQKQEALAQKLDLSAQWVLEHLKQEAQAGDKSKPDATRVQALGLLGKHLGMFVDRSESRNLNLNVDMAMQAEIDRTFTVDELRRLLVAIPEKASTP